LFASLQTPTMLVTAEYMDAAAAAAGGGGEALMLVDI
jgi:hypothetical protein